MCIPQDEDDLIYLLDELKYHTSWDWLMNVVEKIESLPFAPSVVFVDTPTPPAPTVIEYACGVTEKLVLDRYPPAPPPPFPPPLPEAPAPPPPTTNVFTVAIYYYATATHTHLLSDAAV